MCFSASCGRPPLPRCTQSFALLLSTRDPSTDPPPPLFCHPLSLIPSFSLSIYLAPTVDHPSALLVPSIVFSKPFQPLPPLLSVNQRGGGGAGRNNKQLPVAMATRPSRANKTLTLVLCTRLACRSCLLNTFYIRTATCAICRHTCGYTADGGDRTRLTNWSGIELKRTGETRSDPPSDRKTFLLFFNSQVSEKMAEVVVIVH